MFQKICAGITAASSLTTAACVLYVAMSLHACNSGMVEGMKDAESATGIGTTSAAQMEADAKRMEKQLQQRFEDSQRKTQDAVDSLRNSLPSPPSPPPDRYKGFPGHR